MIKKDVWVSNGRDDLGTFFEEKLLMINEQIRLRKSIKNKSVIY